MANEYLKRTPTSTGNRKVFTWSAWVKKTEDSGGFGRFFESGAIGNRTYLTYTDLDEPRFTEQASNANRDSLVSNYKLRDSSSICHVMIAVNSTLSNEDDRVKIYINGSLINNHGFSTDDPPGLDALFQHNEVGETQYIGNSANQAADFQGYMSDIFHVDGQALTPDVFGFYKDGDGYISVGSTMSTDFKPGQWMPHAPRVIKKSIERSGGFGVNGFYLPMNDSSNPGADFHCDPNSIIKLKGEDLPQPRNGAPTTSDDYVSQLRQETGELGFDGVVKFDGVGDYLTIPDNADFAFGTGDFTVEAFVFATGLGTYNTIFDTSSTGQDTTGIRLGVESTGRLYLYTNGFFLTANNAISTGRWYHIAYVRNSGTHRLFVNGVQLDSTSTARDYTNDSCVIGSHFSFGESWEGFISNLRVIKGTAVYTANFTAPTEPLTNVTNTKLLCCNSSTSAIAATVKPDTITANGNAVATRNELTGSIVLAVAGISTARIPSDTELVTNGTFDSTANGWSVTDGSSSTLTYDSTSQNIDIVRNNEQCIETDSTITIESGKFYKLSWELVSTSDGNNGYVYLQMSGTTLNTPTTSDYRGTGKYEVIFNASSTTSAKLRVQAGGVSGLQFTLDNISIKEVSNLIANGHFDTNTTGWTVMDGGSTLSVDSLGRLQLDRNGSFLNAYQDITTEIGKRYTVSGNLTSGTGGNAILRAYRQDRSTGYTSFGSSSGDKISFSFTALETTSSIIVSADNNAGNAFFDNIEVKQEDAPRDYSADIRGSGTNKTVTPTASAVSGIAYDVPSYYGSSTRMNDASSDGLLLGWGEGLADYNFGTGDFTMEAWVYTNTTPTRPWWSILRSKNYNDGVAAPDGGIAFYGNGAALHPYDRSSEINTSLYGGNIGSIPNQQWTHVALVRDNGRLLTFCNGACVGNIANSGNYTNNGFEIGNNFPWYGYIQDIRIYKGLAKYKGGFDVPKPYTPVGIEKFRTTADTCKNNFATWNSVLGRGRQDQLTYSDGNLKVVSGATGGFDTTSASTIAIKGKIYCEFALPSDAEGAYIGIMKYDTALTNNGIDTSGTSDIWLMRGDNGNKVNGSGSSYGGAFSNGDIIMMAVDIDNTSIWWGKNGSWFASGNPAANSNAAYTNLPSTKDLLAICGDNYSSKTPTIIANFGQNPSFSGTTTAGTNADDSGKGLFKYAPPTGFLALCEDNLPTPAIADPGEHFKTVLYSGDNSAGRRISDVGFQPDLVWIKARNASPSHILTDSVRGIGHQLSADDNGVEVDSGTLYLTGFADNGFDLSDGANSGGNTTGRNYVAWCWKAGGAAVTNNDGSRTTQVSVNQTAGFSIGTFTGDVANTHTIGHGLGKVPSVIIVKERTGNSGWAVYHKSRGSTKVSYLNAPDSEYTETGDTSSWNATDPTSSVFSVGKNGATNDNTLVFYAWAEIEGFSKFGSVIGNGNVDGPFVYCGFKPAFVLWKNATDTNNYNWYITDSTRSSTNAVASTLAPNLSNVEDNAWGDGILDFVSNGFKFRIGNASFGDGDTLIFMAFAESPFKTANAK